MPGAGALTTWPSDGLAAEAWGAGGGGTVNPQDLNRYAYALNNPVRYTDSTGHLIDVLLDVAFIAYGVYDIAANGYTHERGLALGADVAAAVVPGVTGAGMVVRGATKVDDVVDTTRAAGAGQDILFGQARVDPTFSTKPDVPINLKGQPLEDIAAKLRAGTLSPDDIPIQAGPSHLNFAS